MDSEEKLNKELETYRSLGAQDKNVDVAQLMVSALNKSANQNYLPTGQKRIAYLLSLITPPIGLFYALRFYLSETEDGQDAALACAAISCLSIFCTVYIYKSMF